MTSGAYRLVQFQLDTVPKDHPFHYLYAKLTARENPWISVQWMTERAGGSDVHNSETIAVYSPLASKTSRFGRMDEGDYLLSGFKIFRKCHRLQRCVYLGQDGLRPDFAVCCTYCQDFPGRKRLREVCC